MKDRPKVEHKTSTPYIRGDLRALTTRRLAYHILVLSERPLEAGRRLGLTRKQVYSMMEGAEFRSVRDEIVRQLDQRNAEFLDEMGRQLKVLAKQSANRVGEILFESGDESVVLRAANSTLDRVGARAPQRTETRHIFEMTPETAALLRDALHESDPTRKLKDDWSWTRVSCPPQAIEAKAEPLSELDDDQP